jgi:hypothetical protein
MSDPGAASVQEGDGRDRMCTEGGGLGQRGQLQRLLGQAEADWRRLDADHDRMERMERALEDAEAARQALAGLVCPEELQQAARDAGFQDTDALVAALLPEALLRARRAQLENYRLLTALCSERLLALWDALTAERAGEPWLGVLTP